MTIVERARVVRRLPADGAVREYIDAAASAGFDAVTIWPTMYRRAAITRSTRPSVDETDARRRRRPRDGDRGVRRLAARHRRARTRRTVSLGVATRSVLRRCQRSSAHRAWLPLTSVAARSIGPPPSTASASCAATHEHEGLSIALEFMPFSGVPDADLAVAVDRRSGVRQRRARGRHQPSAPYGRARVAGGGADRPDRRSCNSPTAPRRRRTISSTRRSSHRFVPGAGEFGIAELIERLDAAGARASVGPEVVSTRVVGP